MPKLVRIKNQLIDLDAIQYAKYTPASEAAVAGSIPTEPRLHLIVGGATIALDADDDAERWWGIIQTEAVDRHTPASPPEIH